MSIAVAWDVSELPSQEACETFKEYFISMEETTRRTDWSLTISNGADVNVEGGFAFDGSFDNTDTFENLDAIDCSTLSYGAGVDCAAQATFLNNILQVFNGGVGFHGIVYFTGSDCGDEIDSVARDIEDAC